MSDESEPIELAKQGATEKERAAAAHGAKSALRAQPQPSFIDPVKPVLVGVVFSKHWGKYYQGDKAGFTQEIADKLVVAGVASYAASWLERVKDRIVKALVPEATGGGAKADTKASLLKTVKDELAKEHKKDVLALAELAGVKLDESAHVGQLREVLAAALAEMGMTVADLLAKPKDPPAAA